ncbi:MAG: DNA repair exonuclease, partial [Candidatus Desulforudis sp.]|nr:DNA repair exonuclease [Desulforudis sp.]
MSSTLRFLHLADVHLDTPFYGKDEQRRTRLRDAVRSAFARAVDVALARRAHAVLVAGDLFDNDLLTFATERFLLEQVQRLRAAGVQFFYATGNHDPGRANYRAHRLDWPDNVFVFRNRRPETVALKDPSGRTVGWITGAGHATDREERNLAADFGGARGDAPHVALLHTQVLSARGAEQHGRYAPATAADLAAGGFDYWALGHVHTRQRVAPDVPAWYAGNIQGRNPRETDLKGGLWV